MLVIGSQALAYHMRRAGLPFRKPADIDLIATKEFIGRVEKDWHIKDLQQTGPNHMTCRNSDIGGPVEFDVAEEGNSNWAYLMQSRPGYPAKMMLGKERPGYASPEMLYSIKRSHRFLPRRWEKHMRDYHLLKKFVPVDQMPEITEQRRKEYSKAKHISLKRTKDEFFDDDVSNHVFEHDQIHEVMAHRARPMFEYIQKEPGVVTCDKLKWAALTPVEQRQCVLEEAYVIALERGIIPMLYEGKRMADSESALQWALMRIGTTLTSGWFREFTVENYPQIWDERNRTYVDKFLAAVETGKIKRLCQTPQ